MLKNLSTKQLIKLYKMRLERRNKIYDKWHMYQYGTKPFWFYARKYRTLDRQCSWIRITLDKRGTQWVNAIEVVPYWSNDNVTKFDD